MLTTTEGRHYDAGVVSGRRIRDLWMSAARPTEAPQRIARARGCAIAWTSRSRPRDRCV